VGLADAIAEQLLGALLQEAAASQVEARAGQVIAELLLEELLDDAVEVCAMRRAP